MSPNARVSSNLSRGKFESVWKEASATALYNGVDEQPILIDKSDLDQGMAERNAAGDHNVQALLILQNPDLLDWIARQDWGVLPLGIRDQSWRPAKRSLGAKNAHDPREDGEPIAYRSTARGVRGSARGA